VLLLFQRDLRESRLLLSERQERIVKGHDADKCTLPINDRQPADAALFHRLERTFERIGFANGGWFRRHDVAHNQCVKVTGIPRDGANDDVPIRDDTDGYASILSRLDHHEIADVCRPHVIGGIDDRLVLERSDDAAFTDFSYRHRRTPLKCNSVECSGLSACLGSSEFHPFLRDRPSARCR